MISENLFGKSIISTYTGTGISGNVSNQKVWMHSLPLDDDAIINLGYNYKITAADLRRKLEILDRIIKEQYPEELI